MLCLTGINCILEEHILVQRIVFGSGLLIAVAIVDRSFEFDLLGQEAPGIALDCNIILVVVIQAALCQALIHCAEAVCLAMEAHVDSGNVAHAQCHAGLRSPATFVVKVSDSELIGPDNTILGRASVIAHTNHDDAHIAQRWITLDGDSVIGVVGILLSEAYSVAHIRVASHLGRITGLLDCRQQVKVDVEHVVLGPHLVSVAGAVGVIASVWREVQRNLVFIVIVLDIRAQSQECRHIAIGQVSGVVDCSLGMQEHLQSLIDAQVITGVAVDATCITRLQSIDSNLHRLLIELCDLRVSRIDDTCHTRRQDVVHRLARGILLDVDGVDIDIAHSRCIATHIEVVIVVAPLTSHELKCSKTQVSCLFESRHEHAHEANGREIGDVAHLLLISAQRDAELIPCGVLFLSIARISIHLLLVDDVVRSYPHRVGMDGDAILEVALILVERVVLVDVLDIGHTACTLIEGITGILGAERVALGSVVMLVSLKDVESLLIVVVAAEEVVVVATRVVDGRERVFFHARNSIGRKPLPQLLDILAIGREESLLVG